MRGDGFGVHLCVPTENLKVLCATSGTTGEPTFYLFSDEDIEVWTEGRSRVFWRIGVRPGDRVLHAFGLSMFVGGIPNILAGVKYGVTVIPVGAEARSERILKFAQLTKPTCLMATPSLASHLVEKAPEVIGHPVRDLGIKVLLCGGEPGAGIPEVRSRLESEYGAKIYDFQGANVSCDAPEYQGMHRTSDDFHLMEIVDPESKEPLELEDGVEGELVSTHLWKSSAPMIRHSPGDILRVYTSPCPCGMTGMRYKIVGRVDDMLKVKGVIVYPAAIKKVVEEFVPKVTGEFRIVLTEPPPRVTPPLKMKIERGREYPVERISELEAEIKERMHSVLRITPQIIWLDSGQLPRSQHKTQIFEKEY
jgi:phenylacetate-CoA ligase